MGHGKPLAIVAVVFSLLAFAAPALARYLPYSYAYNAALHDAQIRAPDLVGGYEYGVDRCIRKTNSRIDCEVHASGQRYVGLGDSGPIYETKKCTWTVVSRYRRGSSLVFYSRRGTDCETTTSP